jgi:Spore coat protein CotO
MNKRMVGRGENQPLMYITEPSVKKASRNMQQFYVIEKTKTVVEEEEVETIDQVEQVSDVAEQNVEEVTMTVIDEIEVEAVEDETSIETIIEEQKMEELKVEAIEEEGEDDEEVIVRKAFKDMTIEEKILFILDSPTYIPKVKCRVSTRRNWYIGYITGLKDKVVFLKVPTRLEPIAIQLEDIHSIQMLGTNDR